MVRRKQPQEREVYDLVIASDMRAAAEQIELGVVPREPVAVRGIHCPKCGGIRRVDLDVLSHGGERGYRPGLSNPVLLELRCRDCHTSAHALLHDGPSGEDVVIVWPTAAGLRTPHTPKAVAYYLDQAARSESVAARSAATAMYRAAVEQLLHEQGFRTGMLSAKIAALEAAINNSSSGPHWAHKLDPAFLKVIKDLGNGSIHTNGGDVSKQDALDAEILRHVRATMQELLDLVYEEPTRRAARLAALQGAAAVVK
jgi:hypothetical protein